MTTLSFPGPEFPAPPSVSLDLPEGWEPLLLPEALVAAAAPLVEGAYRPNVCVTVERVPGGRTLDEAAAQVAARLEAADEYDELGRERTTASGVEAFRIEGGFRTDYAGVLFQAARVVVLPRGAFTDVVHAVATCHGTQALDLVPVLRGVLDGLTLHDATSGAERA